MKGSWSWMKQRYKRRACGREMNEIRDERKRETQWAAVGGIGWVGGRVRIMENSVPLTGVQNGSPHI